MKKTKVKAVKAKKTTRLISYKFDSSQFVKLSSYGSEASTAVSEPKDALAVHAQNLK